jgi:hypothetical protein
MPLLFLIPGLFTLPSLERKGSRAFFLSRLQRLGIPFAIAALFIAPMAFYPSYLMADPRPPNPYLSIFYTSDAWPIGPPWLWDNLSANAFNIYLIHYTVVLWIQYVLLPIPWPAWIKFTSTFIGGLALSWGLSRLIRQIVSGVNSILKKENDND